MSGAVVAMVLLSAAPGAPPSVVRNPEMLNKPTQDQLRAAFPKKALRANVGGRAALECLVTAEGLLTSCQASEEDPVGWGFGEAALTLADKFRLTPKSLGGRTVGGARVHIPMVFGLFGEAIVECTVDEAGLSRNCRLVNETPKNRSIGAQVLRWAEGKTPKPHMMVRNGKVRWTIEALMTPPGPPQ